MLPLPKSQLSIISILLAFASVGCASNGDPISSQNIVVPLDPHSVSVHDPMIIKDDGTY